MGKFLIIRIIGNDILAIHGANQTISNLEFTLNYECKFLNTDKLYVLNRIHNETKKKKIINLLEKYNQTYIDLKFDLHTFNLLPRLNVTNKVFNSYSIEKKSKLLYNYNIYLININNCRNFCIKYGKQNYEWTFILDSNNFFTKYHYNTILNSINETDNYIIIPQIRLQENNYKNDILLDTDYLSKLNKLLLREPQIAVKNTSSITFNAFIPYGLADKGEFINALGVYGIWNTWDSFKILNIKQRHFINVKKCIMSSIVRLQPHHINNNMIRNNENRVNGLFLLVKQLQSL